MTAAAFTCRTARSPAMLSIFVGLVLVETAIVHLLLLGILPPLAYVVSFLSLTAIVWLIADYRAMGDDAIRIDPSSVQIGIGRRVRAIVPRERIARAIAPSWQDLGASAPPYLNATKSANPNVMLVFKSPQEVTLLGAVRRPVERLAMRIDDASALLAAMAPQQAGDVSSPGGVCA